MTFSRERTPFSWVVAMAVCGSWATAARADFVDELPQLPITPAPLPTATVGGRTDSESSKANGRPGVDPAKKATPEAGAVPKPGAKPGGAAASTSPSPAGGGKGSGLFGSDAVKHDANAPIAWQGDDLEGSLGKGILLLKNNVEIRQDDTLMKSDTAELFSKPGTTTPDRAIAKGRVSILKRPNPRVPEIRAVADEIEYFVQERKVILKGQPKIWRGKELLQGEIMELALDTGDIRIRSARSVVDPKNAQQGEKRPPGASTSSGSEKRK